MQPFNLHIALIIFLIILISYYFQSPVLLGLIGLVPLLYHQPAIEGVKYGGSIKSKIAKVPQRSKKNSKTEIEAVFHNISADQFNHIRKVLDEKHLDLKLSNDLVELGKDNMRRITDLKTKQVIYQEKVPVKIEDNGDYKIRVSSETDLEPQPDFQTEKIRKRERWTYKLEQFPEMIFDLTIVQQDGRLKYEVEIETPDLSQTFKDAIEFVKENKFSVGVYVSAEETKKIIAEHNQLVSKLRYFQGHQGPNRPEKDSKTFISGYENKVSDLNVRNLTDDFWITLKYDGVRRIMFITNSGIYLIQRDSLFKIGDKSSFTQEYSGTLIDGEFMGESYHMFDILFYKSYDATHKPLEMRIKYLKEIYQTLSRETLEVPIYLKEYYTGPTTEAAKKALEQFHQNDMPYDGIIFQSTGPYFNKNSYKWKPSELLTIDFMVKDKKLWSYDGDLVEFTADGYESKPFDMIEFDGKNVEGQIIEFKWDQSDRSFKPMRYREDRQNPNGLAIARKVWDKINNPIPEATIIGENLAIIRKYNQDEKMKLLKKYIKAGTNLVDVGSGQGADLHKWNHLGLNKVWIVDPDTEILKTLKERLSQMDIKYKLDILNIGAEESKKIKVAVGNEPFNIASFYSLTFFFKDKPMYKKLFDTLNLLSKGGLFIGAVMDGKSTLELLDGKTKFNNGLFSIETSKHVQLGEFGQNVHINIEDADSMIKDLDEFLFDFDMFKQDVVKQKFELLEDYIPTSVFTENGIPPKQLQFGSLYRYFAFKKL